MAEARPTTSYYRFETSFSSCAFLKLDNRKVLPEDDLQFLELKRCLHLPLRHIQDEFIYQYFLYLHPYYPIIDEKEFWDMYLGRESGGVKDTTMSLLVFQAMLFAASAFVSPVVLKNAGYSNVKVARNIFYRRAKLLFDFGTETDAFTKAQAALLLTFQFSALEPHAGSTWLAIGIQNAIVAQTHTFQAPGSSAVSKKRNKRLWWSLFWRDRVLTLGLRKPLQITSSSFNVNLEPITQEDLANEACHSAVYNPETKQHLADILNFQCRLAVILTEALSICYGPIMRNTLGLPYLHIAILTYVSAAQIALGNHEAMMIEQRQKGIKVIDDSILRGIGRDISHATAETTKLVRFIVQGDLTQHLPISAIAYIAFPLMLSSLDDQISPMDAEAEPEKSLTRYHAQAMHLCSQRFEGAEDISRMITQIVQSTPIQLPLRIFQPKTTSNPRPYTAISPASRSFAGNWDELFVTRLYMRLRLSLDFALIAGRAPTEADLPSSILHDVGIKRLAFGPVHRLSSVTPYSPRKRRASESLVSHSRVIELDETGREIDESWNDSDIRNPQADARPEEDNIVIRTSFDYDTIWAANLFEEMTDLWS
ncbi:hypothetical protein FSARC_4976 [Fusarium sarcochroum]|uniref:Xylanolytic transcriptional activator regulatory domain-containing protein n=1 Tax=Fusarium sarcochroum TaxID=1208366 RepID=A0A8H4U0G6_9HYPO|nr:hypothetical protein FSARC_4976 [Fusarium sarcochroum]